MRCVEFFFSQKKDLYGEKGERKGKRERPERVRREVSLICIAFLIVGFFIFSTVSRYKVHSVATLGKLNVNLPFATKSRVKLRAVIRKRIHKNYAKQNLILSTLSSHPPVHLSDPITTITTTSPASTVPTPYAYARP